MEPFLEKIPNQLGESFFAMRRESEAMNWGWHYHPEIEICFTERGSGKRIVGNNIEFFDNGDMVLLGENLPHAFQSDKDLKDAKHIVQNVVIQFREELFGNMLEYPEMGNIKALIQKASYGLQINGRLKQRVSSLIDELLQAKGFKKLNLLLLVLNEIAERPEDYRMLSSLKYSKIKNSESSRIGKVISYIHSNFKKDLSLNEVAEVANLTPNAFCKYFRKRTNKSFVEYLNELRINQSCELLMSDMYSVKEVAAMTGFKNRSNFNRRFYKVVGKTPSDFSNEYRESFK